MAKVTKTKTVKKVTKSASKTTSKTAKPAAKKAVKSVSKAKSAVKDIKKNTNLKIVDFLHSSKDSVVKAFAQSEGDTGSPEVQIALLTQRILLLQEHLKGHKKDNHSRRGLLQMVGKRRRLIEYLKKTSLERAQKILKAIDMGK